MRSHPDKPTTDKKYGILKPNILSPPHVTLRQQESKRVSLVCQGVPGSCDIPQLTAGPTGTALPTLIKKTPTSEPDRHPKGKMKIPIAFEPW